MSSSSVSLKDIQGEKYARINKRLIGKIANVFLCCTGNYESNERFEGMRKVLREYITVYYLDWENR